MWNYEKRLQYPINITQTNPQMAQVIISQFGGPNGKSPNGREAVRKKVFLLKTLPAQKEYLSAMLLLILPFLRMLPNPQISPA